MAKMASDKQICFINKLWEEKGVEIMPWISLLDKLNMTDEEFEKRDMESWKASQVIEFLLNCKPRRYYEIVAENKKNNIDKYEKLIAWAKERGVKGVRAKMKKVNVLRKIEEVGLKVPVELI